MEVVAFVLFVTFVLFIFSRLTSSGSTKSSPKSSMTIMRGNNGYESHLDFLEMHGFISPEERQAQKDFAEDFKKNPQNYKVCTLDELIKEIDNKKSKKS